MSSFRSRVGLFALIVGTAVGVSTIAARGGEYPERPVRLIVPFAPGGASDYMARTLSARLNDKLGQTFIVENRGGAGGNIGIAAAAHAAPDGYTLLVTSSSIVINPSLSSSPSYDAVKDFQPITELNVSPNVIAVRADSDIKDLKDLIAKANANPGKYNYSTPGVGTTAHFTMEILKAQRKIDIVHVPFAGTGPALQALIGGQVQVTTSGLSALMPFVKSKTIRIIVVSGRKRWPDLPDVPTVAEEGFQNAEVETFQALFAPAGTPKPIVDKLAQEAIAVFQDPALKKSLLETGNLVTATGPADLAARVKAEVPLWAKTIKAANIPVH